MSTKTTPKTYVMLPDTAPTAPIYVQVGPTEKVRLNKLPKWSPYIKTSITTEDGDNKIIRLKLNSNSIFQDEQITKGILANEKFTNAERDVVRFTNGVLITSNKMVQEFLDNHPQNAAFKGSSNDALIPMFKVEDKQAEVTESMSEFRKRLKAANFIAEMEDLKEAQELLIHLNGSFYTPPTDIGFAQQELVGLIEENDEALAKVLAWQEGRTEDDNINVMIGRLVQAKILSFDQIPNQIAKLTNGEMKPIREISSTEYTLEDRQRHLVTFLNSPEGKPLLEDLKKDLLTLDGKSEEANKQLAAKGGKKRLDEQPV